MFAQGRISAFERGELPPSNAGFQACFRLPSGGRKQAWKPAILLSASSQKARCALCAKRRNFLSHKETQKTQKRILFFLAPSRLRTRFRARFRLDFLSRAQARSREERWFVFCAFCAFLRLLPWFRPCRVGFMRHKSFAAFSRVFLLHSAFPRPEFAPSFSNSHTAQCPPPTKS